MQPTFLCGHGWYNEELSDLIHIPRIAMYRSHFCFPSSLDRTALHFISFLSPLCQHNDSHLYCTWVMLDRPPWNQTFTRKSYRFGFTLIIRSWQNTFPPPHIYNTTQVHLGLVAGVLAFDVKITLEEAFLTNNPFHLSLMRRSPFSSNNLEPSTFAIPSSTLNKLTPRHTRNILELLVKSDSPPISYHFHSLLCILPLG